MSDILDKPTIKILIIQMTKNYVDKANDIYPELNLDYPKVEFDLTGRTAGTARAWYMIRYNIDMAMEQLEVFVKRTVPHEVAHLVVSKKNQVSYNDRGYRVSTKSHGKEWKAVMEAFGVEDISRCHEYQVSQAIRDKSFPYKCGCHGKVWWATKHCHKRHQDPWDGKYSCKTCKEDYKLYRRRKFY